MATKKRKRGRPRTAISTDEFVRRRLFSVFDGYVLEMLFGQLIDSGLVSDRKVMKARVESEESLESYARRTWGSSAPTTRDDTTWRTFGFEIAPPTEREAIAFSDGLRFAVDIIGKISFPEFLDYAIERYGLTLNVSRIARERLQGREKFKKKLEGLPESIREKRLKFRDEIDRISPLPNEILRKVKHPKVSRSDILRLRRLIKEYEELPFVDEIAKMVNLTSDELLLLVREARRQKVNIGIGVYWPQFQVSSFLS